MILILVLEFTMAQPPLFGRLMAFLISLDDIGVIAGQDAMARAHLRHLLGGNLHRQPFLPRSGDVLPQSRLVGSEDPHAQPTA